VCRSTSVPRKVVWVVAAGWNFEVCPGWASRDSGKPYSCSALHDAYPTLVRIDRNSQQWWFWFLFCFLFSSFSCLHLSRSSLPLPFTCALSLTCLLSLALFLFIYWFYLYFIVSSGGFVHTPLYLHISPCSATTALAAFGKIKNRDCDCSVSLASSLSSFLVLLPTSPLLAL